MEAGRLRPLPPVLPPFPLDKIGSSCYIITVLSQWYSYDNLKPNLTNTDLRPDQTRAQRPSQESLAETRGYCPCKVATNIDPLVATKIDPPILIF